MASAMLHASMLPCIKCSSCGNEVELSMMGDHKCPSQQSDSEPIRNDHDRMLPPSSAPPTRSSSPYHHSHQPRKQSPLATPPLRPDSPVESSEPPPAIPPIIQTPPEPEESFQSEPVQDPELLPKSFYTRQNPPFINPSIANGLQVHSAPLTPASDPHKNDSYFDQPHSAVGLTPPRSATFFSRPSRPPSPGLSAQQDALSSPFPMIRNFSSPGPLAGIDSKSSESLDTVSGSESRGPLVRNMTAPQLSHSKSKRHNASQEKTGIAGLFRRKSSKSLSKKDISLPDRSDAEPVPSMPNLPSRLMGHTEAGTGDLAVKLDRDGRPLPSGPAPPRPARPDAIDLPGHLVNFPPTSPASSKTLERRLPSRTNSDDDVEERERKIKALRNSDASVYTLPSPPEEPPSGVGSGLPQISEDDDTSTAGSARHPPPSAWQRARLRSTSRSDTSARPAPDFQPPLPRLATSHEHIAAMNAQHTPSTSLSSSGSRFGFDDRTDSSISSPPTSYASSISPWKPSLEDQIAQMDAVVDGPPKFSQHPRRAANFSRPRVVASPAAIPADPSPPLNLPLESPTDPALQNGHFVTDFADRSERGASEQAIESPLLSSHSEESKPPYREDRPAEWPPIPTTPHHPPIPSRRRPSLNRRKTSSATKGNCRGCGLEIIGKSVKAADGRLSGRYHKECFVCRSCHVPFPTAEFYVMRDAPYCAFHYHSLNNSLCQRCHGGIEGRYLETHSKRKFHIQCFTCHDCHQPLSRDYFENVQIEDLTLKLSDVGE